jgi:FkbM family methyltransferase
MGSHSQIWADRRFVNSIEAAIGNPPEWEEMQAWKKILGKDTLFVDIGANVGTYALWAADLGSSVIAVEPIADSLKALSDNAVLNGYRIEIVPAALANTPGKMRMTNWLATNNHLLFESESESESEKEDMEVEVRTLDSVLGDRTAHGVKIDVEGAERLVLEGATRALEEGRLLVIQVEWNVLSENNFGESRTRLAEMLSGYGYKFYRPDEHGNLQPTGTEVSPRDLFAIKDR